MIASEWTAMPLPADAFALTGDPLKPAQGHEAEKAPAIGQILRRNSGDGEHWFVLTRPENSLVLINGIPLAAGLRNLRDRDELRIGSGERMFFSTESLACAEPFPGLAHEIFCPRCKQEIAPQSVAVRCPQCAAWHHQSEEFPCWTYSERCALCDQSSSLETGYRWTPENL